MKYLRFQLVVLGILGAISGTAHALSTGNDLLGLMRGGIEERTIALQYLNGVTDGIYQVEELTGRDYLCAPAGVTLGQMRDVVQQHLEANPASRHLSAKSLVYVSLSRAWPCPARGK